MIQNGRRRGAWPGRRWGGLGGLLLAVGLLAGCAAGKPATGKPAAESPDVVGERAQREQVESAHRQLLAEHQRLLAENQQLLPENRQLKAERQRLLTERQQLRDGQQRLVTEHQRLQGEHQRLVREHQEATKRGAAAGASEEELARLRLSLLERDAQIKLLTQKLDAAILEVVRALAKLRSLESKAEAATNLAEAEVALKMLERSSAGREKPPDVAQAEQLLKLGAEEFRKDNYSGALYLSTQAKTLAKGSQPEPASGESAPRLDGEVAFALPLPLRVLARGEAREGPGPGFKVAFVVAGGAPVTARSYKGLWVRVRDGEGRSGWLRHNLVGQR